ncbi:hypothetical protein OCGS_0211 [Oceaniovalibus guishaninsula JLT2003]|uniref:Nucleotide-diphospho-sugar transferase domain-containing protein n=1 Tax=Oceaniovalibus guishaninsula JLT2003 TaxID=1231392 RepID=K2HSI1_9RHOB|nr:hypothetical protein [Oceaniovalibus guishaninsula]EKE45594.1 hypothetical protein OCGS_0211 [Oceaniovalibus guishaninsula JLT2003]
MSATPAARAPRGFVLACSGAGYLPLAVHTARSVAATHPDLPVDLFTDAVCDDPVFAAVHPLERSWFRPKFEAMRRSRFGRTIYLDTDLRVLARVDDVFDLLDRFDLAGAHDAWRASPRNLTDRGDVPVAFPQINSGVLALRRDERVHALLAAVEAELLATGARKDQPILRRHLWASDLRLAVLPEEYNLMAYRHAAQWSNRNAAPRIVHNSRFSTLGDADLAALTGRRLARHIARLIANDPTLQPGQPGRPGATSRRILPLADRGVAGGIARIYDKLRLAGRRMRKGG